MLRNFTLKRIAAVTLFASLALAGACGAGRWPIGRVQAEPGSCETTCNHYERCKGRPDLSRKQTCLSECRSIFSEGGREDNTSLSALQGLSCTKLLSFIEGPQSRPLRVDSCCE